MPRWRWNKMTEPLIIISLPSRHTTKAVRPASCDCLPPPKKKKKTCMRTNVSGGLPRSHEQLSAASASERPTSLTSERADSLTQPIMTGSTQSLLNVESQVRALCFQTREPLLWQWAQGTQSFRRTQRKQVLEQRRENQGTFLLNEGRQANVYVYVCLCVMSVCNVCLCV